MLPTPKNRVPAIPQIANSCFIFIKFSSRSLVVLISYCRTHMPPDMFEVSPSAINIPMPETALFAKNEPMAAQLLLVSSICRADFARLNKFYR
jgi:hypothetical protein